VYGRHTEFYTDHEPLATMNRLKKPLGRLGRLFHRLQDVDHEIVYLPGSLNFLSDFLSRSFDIIESKTNYIDLQSNINCSAEQAKDNEIRQINKLINDIAGWLLNGPSI
jgi:hypothetical protein